VKANVVLTCIELSGLLLIIGVGIYTVSAGRGDASRLTQIDTGDSGAFLAITAATSLAFFAMVGFEDSVNMAEGNATRRSGSSRAAMLLGMATAAAIYVAVAVLSSMLVPAGVLADAGSDALFRVLDAGAPGYPLAVFAAIGLFAVVNSALINMLMASRLLYGMANERIIPLPFCRVHESRRTPWVAIVFTSAVAIVLVVTADISLLGGTTALLLLEVFTIVNVAVLVLRRDHVDHPHFRAPT
jgi:amino acid transporter